jgi:hypothetical protein
MKSTACSELYKCHFGVLGGNKYLITQILSQRNSPSNSTTEVEGPGLDSMGGRIENREFEWKEP